MQAILGHTQARSGGSLLAIKHLLENPQLIVLVFFIEDQQLHVQCTFMALQSLFVLLQ